MPRYIGLKVSNRLTEAQRAEIRAAYAAGGVTQKALAHKYGVSQVTISKVVGGAK
jgi:DNA-binding transcriptional regulator LsrR (DeoR family)